uniref:Uncharacterized protein n=1 Tax=Chromera velia CCMP2878 TaxID=1169474 RepID=A0A0G4HX49_9ALVE|eukprot:Cvel_32936.t1-p1 / transcript=Cvel_32936.t1 / gene=Cvel_32936 / organism=Chromera_velia_CCMP2878 / gene_product=Outer dense fiber protein 1, putative / transcript_product=Outer dense fiber protein 1, putative / location=Cvel_scaffold5224:2236-5567(+) / protein_length=109 / sequence_SO=supercontig / SO=protein_coding / is_pseudo=false
MAGIAGTAETARNAETPEMAEIADIAETAGNTEIVENAEIVENVENAEMRVWDGGLDRRQARAASAAVSVGLARSPTGLPHPSTQWRCTVVASLRAAHPSNAVQPAGGS